eukprot:gene10905-22762_t
MHYAFVIVVSMYFHFVKTSLISIEKGSRLLSRGLHMKSPTIFPAGFQLPKLEEKGFTILSWNVLLPNSQDNWWCEKMYQQHVPIEERKWPHRQRLMSDYLNKANADIVCIQEAAGESFDDDFQFMHKAGYESILHKKFRFRCATFYKPDKFQLIDTAHRDRSLVTSFICKQTQSNEDNEMKEKLLYISNCHLSGGAAPERRLRQIHEVTEQ